MKNTITYVALWFFLVGIATNQLPANAGTYVWGIPLPSQTGMNPTTGLPCNDQAVYPLPGAGSAAACYCGNLDAYWKRFIDTPILYSCAIDSIAYSPDTFEKFARIRISGKNRSDNRTFDYISANLLGSLIPDNPEDPCINATGSQPVKLSRGEKYYHFTDVPSSSDFPLGWERSYRVSLRTIGGTNWASSQWYWPILDMRANGNNSLMSITLDDGTGTLNFSFDNFTRHWRSLDSGFGVSDSLTTTANGLKLVRGDNTAYEFNSDGYVTKITRSDGLIHSFTYIFNDANGALTSVHMVDDASGDYLDITMSPENNPAMVTDKIGQVTEYKWDTLGRLRAVVYPDGVVQVFEYDSGAQPHSANAPRGAEMLITGIFEVNKADYDASIAASPTPLPESKRYSKVAYDDIGRVAMSALWTGSALTQQQTFAYSWADWSSTTTTPSTTLTTTNGSNSFSTVYTFSTGGSALTATRNWQLVGVDGQEVAGAVSGCAATSASTNYDSNGFLQTTSDNKGAVFTKRDRDGNGRITTLRTGLGGTLASPTDVSDSQKISTPTYQGDTTLPTLREFYGHQSGSWLKYRTEAFHYDTNNRVDLRTVTDNATGVDPAPTGPRVWAYTNSYYSGTAIPQSIVVNGPRDESSDPGMDGHNDVTTYNYSNDGQLSSVVDALGHTTTYTDYNGFGLPETITDVQNSVVTTLDYDARGRLIDSTTAGANTHIDYWPNGLVQKVTSPDLSWLYYTYNSAHQLTSVSNQAGEHVEYTPSVLNGKWEKAVTYKAAGNAGANITAQQRRLFDALGRLWKTQEINPADIQDASASAFDKTIFNYDANDNLQTVVALGDGSINTLATPATYDSANRVTFREFDGQNRIKCSMDTSPVAPYTCMGSVTSTKYTYDDQGNVASVEDANHHFTRYYYNGFGELVREESPDRGVTTYEYDLAGNLHIKTKAAQAVEPEKQIITYGWDALNRLTGIDYPGTAQDITYVYDEAGHGASVGRLTHVLDANGRTDYHYNAFGNVLHKVETLSGGLVQTTDYGYNSANELASITYPGGQTVTVTRENSVGGETLGRISALSNGGADVISSVSHQPFGGITGWNTNSNDLINQYIRTYDANGHLAQWGVGATSQNETAMYTLQYDAFGSISAMLDPDNLVKEAYEYDTQNRLNKVTAEYGEISYGYDNAGNRISKVFNRFDPAANAMREFYTEAYGINANSNRIDSITRTQTSGGTTTTVRRREFGYDGRGNVIEDRRGVGTGPLTSYGLHYGDSDRLNSIDAP